MCSVITLISCQVATSHIAHILHMIKHHTVKRTYTNMYTLGYVPFKRGVLIKGLA